MISQLQDKNMMAEGSGRAKPLNSHHPRSREQGTIQREKDQGPDIVPKVIPYGPPSHPEECFTNLLGDS